MTAEQVVEYETEQAAAETQRQLSLSEIIGVVLVEKANND